MEVSENIWEHRRWIISAVILAGMSANSNNSFCPSPNRAEDAVLLADTLIRILADRSRPSLCDDLYKKKDRKPKEEPKMSE